MIERLENNNKDIATAIFCVFQNSYKIEAQLIGTKDFPPLARDVNNIRDSKTEFYGYFEEKELAAVIEIQKSENNLSIDSLTVDPDNFRKGIANKLMTYVLNLANCKTATVETAVVNLPAIKLYNKLGFKEFKRWTPSHGIEKLALSLEKLPY